MTAEHPFAQYVRILGKGPNLSRSLTREETAAAARMILAGQVEPVQLGAFLCLLRVRTEEPAEMAGFLDALADDVRRPDGMAAPDLNWPSYAGKSRRLPYYLLAAIALADSGVSILMHGAEDHTPGRLYTRAALAALGLPLADSAEQAAAHLASHRLAHLPLAALSPRLQQVMDLRRLLGLRSPLHSILRQMNPWGAAHSVCSVFHPNYRAVHVETGRLLGDASLAVIKGDGGEFERRPEKPCEVEALRDGAVVLEEWPALLAESPVNEDHLDPARLAALWRGAAADRLGEAAVIGTIALVLRQMGRAASPAEAIEQATALWAGRNRGRL